MSDRCKICSGHIEDYQFSVAYGFYNRQWSYFSIALYLPLLDFSGIMLELGTFGYYELHCFLL